MRFPAEKATSRRKVIYWIFIDVCATERVNILGVSPTVSVSATAPAAEKVSGSTAGIGYDWGDALLGRCSPAEVVTEGEADLAAAPRNYDEAFTPEKFSALIKEISEGYDIVLIDSPAGIGSGFRLACSAAGKAIAVTTPDPVCVRSCARAVDEIKASGIEDVRLIINMFEAKSVTKSKLLNIDECVDITCARLLGVIPMDRTLVFTEVTGEEADEFAPASQAFFRITRRLLGERVQLFCE